MSQYANRRLCASRADGVQGNVPLRNTCKRPSPPGVCKQKKITAEVKRTNQSQCGSLRPAAKEPPNSHGGAEDNSRKTAADNSSAESDVEHLHAVTLAAAVDKSVCVVCARELPAFGYGHFEEIAQWLPALAHLVLEQVLRWYEGADLGVVFVEATLAVLLKVAFPEFGPEFC